MATLLLTREQLTREQLFREQLSRKQTVSSAPQGPLTPNETDNNIMRITHWSQVQQARLLASLAVISRQNRGWILIANGPAPLSRRILIDAGVNPARVIEVKRASESLLQQARACTGIAALVCWQPGGAALPLPGHRGQSLFIITPTGSPPTLVQPRCAASPAMMDASPGKTGITRYRRLATGETAGRGLTRGYCGSIR